jgi:predicted PurR-regulated permease PerM
MMTDPLTRTFAHGAPRALLLTGLFVGLLWVFADLLPVLAAYAVFQRVFAWLGGALSTRTGWPRGRSALVVSGALLALVVGVLIYAGGFVASAIVTVQQALPGLLTTIQANPLIHQALERIGEADVAENGWMAALHGMELLREAGYFGINVAVGFGLALIHAFEEDDLIALERTLHPTSVLATLVRWLDHVGDGLAITVQLQFVVAACNALLTFPALWIMGLPYTPALVAMIFILALVPVVGNLISGAVLVAVAWPTHGWLGVGVFTAITFLLGKIEGFVLNPRLAAQHVRLPGFVLTVSLVMWEDIAGFVGFFLSFPFLYTVLRIRAEYSAGGILAERPESQLAGGP